MRRRTGSPELSEADVSPQIKQAFEASGCVLFRNNVGVAKFGPRWVAYGVGGKGGADHIGFLPVRVTQDMVGHIIAVFCAPESKRPKNAEIAEKQIEFRNRVCAAGGIAGICHSWQDARALALNWFLRFKK